MDQSDKDLRLYHLVASYILKFYAPFLRRKPGSRCEYLDMSGVPGQWRPLIITPEIIERIKQVVSVMLIYEKPKNAIMIIKAINDPHFMHQLVIEWEKGTIALTKY